MAKFIVIGLGNFGASLAQKLTSLGHEVVGTDIIPSRVELLRDTITHTVCLDVTNEQALRTLPLKDTRGVIVAIGENFGASVHTTALLKKLGVERVIGRVMSPVHKTILESIGVKELIMPEEDSANRLAKSLDMKGVVDSFGVSEEYTIIEAIVPDRYIGQSILSVDFRGKYNLNIITIKKCQEVRNLLGQLKQDEKIQGVLSPDYVFEEGDKVLLFGKDKDLDRVLK